MQTSQFRHRIPRAQRISAILPPFFLTLWALMLAGCEPSPTSQALVAQQRTAANDNLDADIAPDPETAKTPQPDPPPSPPAEPPQPAIQDEVVEIPDLSAVPDSVELVDGSENAKPDLELLGHFIPAGTSQRLTWAPSELFEGASAEAPILVINGREPGPTLCLTAAIHGDELNGIEMVRRVLHDIDPDDMHGAIIGVPIVNLQGFRRGSRYLPDRRDLNRFFPGNPQGSSASRIAHSLFDGIIRHCDALIDLHTGSFYRTNLPQLRADLRYPMIKELTLGIGGIAVLHSEAAGGTLRRAATDAGIPAVTLEAGEPLRLQSSQVSQGVTGIFALLDTLGMVNRMQLLAPPVQIFYESTWVRADNGGILFSVVRLGQSIAVGDVLGTVTDPISNEQNLIYAPVKGLILGMALNQVVQPGFAAFRIGMETEGPPLEPGDPEVTWAGKKLLLGDDISNTPADSSAPASANQDIEERSE